MTNRDWIETFESDRELAEARIKYDDKNGFYGDFEGFVNNYWDAVEKEVEWLREEHIEQ